VTGLFIHVFIYLFHDTLRIEQFPFGPVVLYAGGVSWRSAIHQVAGMKFGDKTCGNDDDNWNCEKEVVGCYRRYRVETLSLPGHAEQHKRGCRP
jgi:hypothetical protein